MTEQKKPEDRIEPSFDMPEAPADPEPHPSASDIANAFDAEFAASGLTPDGEVEALRAEVAELKDQVLRALAEAENTRRRAERERQDTARYAVGNFAKAVLSVADNMTRALQSVTPEAREVDPTLKNLCIGLDYTLNELHNAYHQFGIRPIEALGKRFDATYHQAMLEVDDPSVPAGTVVQEVQKGYMIHDRLLRPAMVGVSKGGPQQARGGDASQAYARQEAAADQPGDGKPHVDKEL
jgi:molecular chaperone GrpE